MARLDKIDGKWFCDGIPLNLGRGDLPSQSTYLTDFERRRFRLAGGTCRTWYDPKQMATHHEYAVGNSSAKFPIPDKECKTNSYDLINTAIAEAVRGLMRRLDVHTRAINQMYPDGGFVFHNEWMGVPYDR